MNKVDEPFQLQYLLKASSKIMENVKVEEETAEGLLLQLSIVSQMRRVFQDSENRLKTLINKAVIPN